MTATTVSIARQRLEKLSVKLENGCIKFLGTLVNGYGTIMINKKVIKAHRLSYEIYKGEITNGLFVLHKCDNPWCINPDHLFLGTQQDNVNDMINKKRFPSRQGASNGRSLLCVEEVIEIKQALKKKTPKTVLSNKYKVSLETIKAISSGRNWGWIDV